MVERLDAAFHPQTRVVSQVTCNGRSLSPAAAPDSIVGETALLLASLDVEVLSDKWSAVGMARILGRAELAGQCGIAHSPVITITIDWRKLCDSCHKAE